MTKKFLIKMVPFVTFDAHEKCKAIGRQLESELRSIAVANLQALKNLRNLKLSDVQFVPLSIRRFIADGVRLSSSAARRIEPVRATSTTWVSSLRCRIALSKR